MADSTPQKKGLTLDEVFVQKAPVKPSPGKAKIRLTPLSKKSCLIHGIDPAILQEVDYASFAAPGKDPEIQTMEYEMYYRTRDKLYEIASEQRSKLAAKGEDSFSTTDSVSVISKTSTSIDRAEQEISTLIENEKKRLAKVQARQQKELLRMLEYEARSKEIMDKQQSKADEAKMREEQRRKAKQRREMQAAEEARIRELRRIAKAEAEASLSRQKLAEQYERDKKIRQRKLLEEKEAKKKAKVEELERAKKREYHRLQTIKVREKQMKETEEKQRVREKKERERAAKTELKRLVDQQAAEAKREETRQRIEKNLASARQLQEEKQNSLKAKQARHDEFMDVIASEKQLEMKERQQRNEAMERKRKHQRRKQKESEEGFKCGVRSKIERDESRLNTLAEERRKEQMILKAEKELQLQMKRENLERIKKAQEYRAKEAQRKAQEADQRSQDLKKRKEDLLRLRRKNAHEAKIKKDKIMALVESSKTGNSSGVKKLLKSIFSGTETVTKKSYATKFNDSYDDASSLGPPPSFSGQFGDEEFSPAQRYKSPYITDYS